MDLKLLKFELELLTVIHEERVASSWKDRSQALMSFLCRVIPPDFESVISYDSARSANRATDEQFDFKFSSPPPFAFVWFMPAISDDQLLHPSMGTVGLALTGRRLLIASYHSYSTTAWIDPKQTVQVVNLEEYASSSLYFKQTWSFKNGENKLLTDSQRNELGLLRAS